jgi:hypothetical protein
MSVLKSFLEKRRRIAMRKRSGITAESKGCKVFPKLLNGKYRTVNFLCIWLLAVIILAGASKGQSPSKEYVIPQFGPQTRVDGKDIAPYQITSEQIRTFLDKVKKREEASATPYGRTIFRIYGRLPNGYRELLSEFFVREYVTWNRQSKRGVYHIEASRRYAINLGIDLDHDIVTGAGYVGDVSGPKLDITPEAISDTNALQLMRNYVEFHNTKYLQLEDYFISTARFGKRTRFLYLTTKDTHHPYTVEFIMDNAYGGIREKDLKTITWTCRREFPKSEDPLLHKILIETFLRLDNKDQRIISSTADIPKYSTYKLDPDLENTVRPMFSFVRRRGYAKVDTLIYVVYTYEQDNGIVRRYRFPFKNKEVLFETPTCVVIARHIGGAYYRL